MPFRSSPIRDRSTAMTLCRFVSGQDYRKFDAECYSAGRQMWERDEDRFMTEEEVKGARMWLRKQQGGRGARGVQRSGEQRALRTGAIVERIEKHGRLEPESRRKLSGFLKACAPLSVGHKHEIPISFGSTPRRDVVRGRRSLTGSPVCEECRES
jgi:hypothetical protein